MIPYLLTRLQPDPGVAKMAFELRKPGPEQTTYHVHLDEHGWHCDCPDGCYDVEHEQRKCKHVEAIKSTLLLT